MSETGRPSRPLGVALLAILNLVSGATMIFMVVVASRSPDDLNGELARIGVSGTLVRGFLVAFGALFVAVAVALWGGRSKGWWFATWAMGLMGIRNVLVSAVLKDVWMQLGAATAAVEAQQMKFFVRGVLYLAIVAYLFRSRVLRFYGVDVKSRGKTFLKLAAAVGGGSLIWLIGELLLNVSA